jgi:hypothetical protein
MINLSNTINELSGIMAKKQDQIILDAINHELKTNMTIVSIDHNKIRETCEVWQEGPFQYFGVNGNKMLMFCPPEVEMTDNKLYIVQQYAKLY